MGAQTLGSHTAGTVTTIHPIASQNLPPTPQPKAEKGLTYTRVSHSTLRYCVTTPPAPPPERLRYDAALVVPDSVTGSGEVAIQEIGGGEYAVAMHRGPYDRLGEIYAALCGQWLPASGRGARNAPPLEFYRTSFGEAPPEEFLTEIFVPLA